MTREQAEKLVSGHSYEELYTLNKVLKKLAALTPGRLAWAIQQMQTEGVLSKEATD